jgi:hypothetical protein
VKITVAPLEFPFPFPLPFPLPLPCVCTREAVREPVQDTELITISAVEIPVMADRIDSMSSEKDRLLASLHSIPSIS